MATTQEVELLRRQFEELNGRMGEMRQQSSDGGVNGEETVLTDVVRTMGQSVTRPHVPGKDFDDWYFTFNGYAGNLDL